MADTAPTHHNLDFMRSLAVAVVFIDHATLAAGINFFHSWDLRWLGDFGVYLFFVHTCLVLMWSLERRPHTLDFYVRRIFRIYPLAILTVSFIATTRFNAMYTPYPLFPSMVLSNLLLIQNLWQRPNIVGVLWSLPLELEMYVLLPALFIFARRERAVWPFLLFWTFACFAAVATYGKDFGNGLYAVIPHFLPGVMAYIAFKHRKAVLPAWSFVAFLLVLLVCFEYVPGVKQGWLVCLIVGLALPSFIDFRESLFTRLSNEIAKYSYGIYLLHLHRLPHALGPAMVDPVAALPCHHRRPSYPRLLPDREAMHQPRRPRRQPSAAKIRHKLQARLRPRSSLMTTGRPVH